MPNQESSPEIDHSWIPSSAWRCHHFHPHNIGSRREADFLDDVPVMSATVLGLEILLHESSTDLRMASELILSDVGATIHILRLVGRENELAPERPNRMVDCLAGLEVATWFGALSSRRFASDHEHSATTAIWKHCRMVAQNAELVAESIHGISPENAYLVGLFHEIESIPSALGWPDGCAGSRNRSALAAIEDSLPLFVLAAIRTLKDSSPSSTWRFILTLAHKLADPRAEFDLSALSNMRYRGTRTH